LRNKQQYLKKNSIFVESQIDYIRIKRLSILLNQNLHVKYLSLKIILLNATLMKLTSLFIQTKILK